MMLPFTPNTSQTEPAARFEEWLPLRGRWLRHFVLGMQIAVAILVWLFLLPRYNVTWKKGPVAAARSQLACFVTAIELYRADHDGRCPASLRDLVSPPPSFSANEAARWQGPYLNDVTWVPDDPWGTPYLYEAPGPAGAAYRITCLGRDGRHGGRGESADLVNKPRRD
jgi:general secretion pathway protein G